MQKNSKTLTSNEDFDVKYSHIIKVITDWVDTTNLIVVAGRGMAKSTVIQARRSADCVTDMPGAPLAFAANTYRNLVDNIMPAVKTGWAMLGFKENLHYITGKRPPESWRKKCNIIIDDYRYVISFYNGSVIFLGSLDHPSLLAGKSVVHLFMDEAKYSQDRKVNRALPILRGDAISYGHSHYFLGVTISTDMPDVMEGEYDWFFRYVKEMDEERIEKIVQAAGVLNELRLKLYRQSLRANKSEESIRKTQKEIEYYENGLRKMRKGATYFINASSFANIDILTIDYIKQLFNGSLELHEFNKSVSGMRPGLKRDIRFYVAFSEQHKYGNGTRSGEVSSSSLDLIYIRQDEEYDFMQELMSGKNNVLPRLLIDSINCRELISSIEKAPAGIRYKGQQKIIYKVKKSEKLELKKLPMMSTNFSDAFKYLMMRTVWRNSISGKKKARLTFIPGVD